MTYNIYAGTNYVCDREETIKNVISNRPDLYWIYFSAFVLYQYVQLLHGGTTIGDSNK